MTSKNYSQDVELLDAEIIDYDTKYLNETGINDGRMRLPTRYDISKFYQRNVRNRGKHRAGEYGQWKKKTKEDMLDFSDDFEWQITYSFPATRRNPLTENGVVYGGQNVTFRRLYLILCEHFNGGEYFVDEYFDTVYPYTIKQEVDEYLSDVKQSVIDNADKLVDELNLLNESMGLDEIKINKDGTLSKSAKRRNAVAYKAVDEYERKAREWENKNGEIVANMIKNDIISCVTTGQLPCQFLSAPSESTMKQRIRAGLSPMPLFSATESLIRSIQLYVNIGGNGKWQIQSGLLV